MAGQICEECWDEPAHDDHLGRSCITALEEAAGETEARAGRSLTCVDDET